ncbi:MAG: DegT/DnrJ/EryC1/StrS family aminotransferase [Elusimicrobia bacterium]|nr:DegT/DnrJ/EryC1/StrS family aminotransferase [Elusimicrobiota bacterium]MDE2314089.1 DegT/DnrJ/EryC1/StrS family aminotransferase [Elusimicrobiota bacterium]
MYPLDQPILGAREITYLKDCVRRGWLSWQGEYVARLERAFAQYCGTPHALSVSSGSSALMLALQTLGIGKGDEVVVPALTFSATAFAATLLGASVRFIDCAPGSLSIDPDALPAVLTRRTRAVIAVHLYGRPADMDAIKKTVAGRRIAVIEDAAQAAGAEYKGRRAGSLGHAGCFSFHNKLIASGEGGMIVFSNRRLLERARFLRSPAPENRTAFNSLVMNNRMSNLHAAVALAQLERLEQTVAGKRRVAGLYNRRLAAVPGIEILPEPPHTRSVYWRYTAFVEKSFPLTRDQLVRVLNSRGIQARAIFRPLHLHPVYGGARRRSFPVAEDFSKRGFDLPTSPNLSAGAIDDIVRAITAAARGRRRARSRRN